MSVMHAFILVALGASFVMAGFAVAVNKISAVHDRRSRNRYMAAYYVSEQDPQTPAYLPERMW